MPASKGHVVCICRDSNSSDRQAHFLQSHGYYVITVKSTEAAVQMCRQQHFCIVLSDERPPACADLLAAVREENIPILFTSGVYAEELLQRIEDALRQEEPPAKAKGRVIPFPAPRGRRSNPRGITG